MVSLGRSMVGRLPLSQCGFEVRLALREFGGGKIRIYGSKGNF